jgi:hypothetical protein
MSDDATGFVGSIPLDAQLEQLHKAGCSKIYREKVTGAKADLEAARCRRTRRRGDGDAQSLRPASDHCGYDDGSGSSRGFFNATGM